MVRRGLRMVLDTEDGLTVVAEAGDVESALRATREHRPRVVVLDLNMPGDPTLPAIPRFLEASPGVAVVVLTMESDPVFARRALAAGASGYVLKEGAEDELVDADPRSRPPAGRISIPASAAASRPVGQPSSASARCSPATASTAIAGRGGMGVVYRATDLTLDRRVALKLIAPSVAGDEEFRARFERECRVAASLEHPHVVPIFHAGQEGDRLYVTMRFVEGTDLRALLAEEGRLDPRARRRDRRPGRRRARRGAPARPRPPRRQARQHPASAATATAIAPISPTSASPSSARPAPT